MRHGQYTTRAVLYYTGSINTGGSNTYGSNTGSTNTGQYGTRAVVRHQSGSNAGVIARGVNARGG